MMKLVESLYVVLRREVIIFSSLMMNDKGGIMNNETTF
jgi:hypothetical protein